MSFWDRIKPSTKTPTPLEYQRAPDGRVLTLTWEDGAKRITAQKLRRECPCAACVDEWTHQRTLDVRQVPEDLSMLQLQPVGNYALAFVFSDRHNTGIYPWTLLRTLG